MTITSAPINQHPTSPLFQPEDHRLAVATLSAAFHRDPVFEWIYPDPTHRRAAVLHFFSVLVEQFASRHQVRVTPDVDGVALWLPPGEELLPEAVAEPIVEELVAKQRLVGLGRPGAVESARNHYALLTT